MNLEIHENIVQARRRDDWRKTVPVSRGRQWRRLSTWIGTPRLTEDVGRLLAFGVHLCDGMSHAAAKGLAVHRDIKPTNCLITEDGILKVTDFGLAKVTSAWDVLLRVAWLQEAVMSGTDPPATPRQKPWMTSVALERLSELRRTWRPSSLWTPSTSM